MGIAWMLLGALVLAGNAGAWPCTVNARLTNVAVAPPAALFQAKSTAAAIFAGIGVTLQWHSGAPRGTACWASIEIRLEAGTAANDRPQSMAYAMPYQNGGPRISVFVERVASMAPLGRVGPVLGHVLAHEITHLLQGVDRHSDRGIMKAHWDTADFRAMCYAALPFDALDVVLIKAAVKRPPIDTVTGTASAANF